MWVLYPTPWNGIHYHYRVPFTRLPHSVEDSHLQFVNTWMQQHIDDAANLLGMPILIGEFGVSLKDGRFGNEFRESFMETVYTVFSSSWKSGVIGGGCLVWQLFPENAEHMECAFTKSPSTLNVLSNHSRALECWECVAYFSYYLCYTVHVLSFFFKPKTSEIMNAQCVNCKALVYVVFWLSKLMLCYVKKS